MRGKLWFIGGLAAGFVLGARSGRETYEQLVVKGRKVLDHPTVQEAAGVAQAQATRLYTEGREKLSQTRLGEKLHVNSSTGDGSNIDNGSSTDNGSNIGNGSSTDNTRELTAADTALAGATSAASRSTGTSTSPATTEPRSKPTSSHTNGSTI